jgi:hypothetical protein
VPAIAEECPDGSYAAAQYVDEGGQCVLMISCPPTNPTMPVSPPPTSPPPTSPKCTGALPQICEVCSDGTSSCAHYVVENGECKIQICPEGPGMVNPGGPIQVPPSEPVDAGPTGCSQGAACEQGEGCGSGSANGGCSMTCSCGSGGTFECTGECTTSVSSPPSM